MHVVIWRIALHVLVELGILGVAPLVVLVDGERCRFVEHGREGVAKRSRRDSAGDQVRTRIYNRADEQASRAAAADGELTGIRVALLDQLDRARDEVIERVGLAQELAVLVPLPAHLSPASDVDDRKDDTASEQAAPPGVEHGIGGKPGRAVAGRRTRMRSVSV